MLDPPVDGAEVKVKQTELDRLAEFGGCGKEASHDPLGVGPQMGQNQSHEGVQGRRDVVPCLRTRLNSEHRTNHRLVEFEEVVPLIHCRRDQRVLPHGGSRRVIRGPTG